MQGDPVHAPGDRACRHCGADLAARERWRCFCSACDETLYAVCLCGNLWQATSVGTFKPRWCDICGREEKPADGEDAARIAGRALDALGAVLR